MTSRARGSRLIARLLIALAPALASQGQTTAVTDSAAFEKSAAESRAAIEEGERVVVLLDRAGAGAAADRSISRRLLAARQQLASAETRLETARQLADVQALPAIEADARMAARELDGIRGRLLDEGPAPAGPEKIALLERLDEKIAEAQHLLNPNRGRRPQVRRQALPATNPYHARLVAALDRAVRARNGSFPAMREATRELSRACRAAIHSLEPPGFRGDPPPVLREAAAAFFDGRYEAVVAQLAGWSHGNARFAAQANLFLAAANYQLFQLGGGTSIELWNRAASNVVRCREEDATIEPDSTAFSPRFVAFFDAVD
jgi:hypothetical protein